MPEDQKPAEGSPAILESADAAKDAAKTGAKGAAKGATKFIAGAIGGEKAEKAVDAASAAKGRVDQVRAGASKAKSTASEIAGDFKAPQSVKEVKAEAKEAVAEVAKGAAQGAIRGAAKGGLWGAVAEGSATAAKSLTKTRGGRRTIYAVVAIILAPALVLGGSLMLSFILMISAVNNSLASAGTEAALASGASPQNVSEITSGSESSAPWALRLWLEENKPGKVADGQLEQALTLHWSAGGGATLTLGTEVDMENGTLRLGEDESAKQKQGENERMIVAALMAMKDDGTVDPNRADAQPGQTRSGYIFGSESEAKGAFQAARMWEMGQAAGCGVAGTAQAAPGSSLTDTSGPAADVGGVSWKPDQIANAQQIIGAAKGYFAGSPETTIRRAGIIALATAMQEATLTNVEHGDNAGPDSRGLFQQRDSWGTLEQRMNPAWAAAKFLSVLAGVPGWEQMKLGDAAYKVQIFQEGLEGHYNKWEPIASAMWDQYAPATQAIPKPADLAAPPAQAAASPTAPGGAGANCQQQQTGSFGPMAGGVALPIDPSHPITDFFGSRSCGGNCSPYHHGIDFGASCGVPLYAIADGVVVEAANSGGVGNVITIFHEQSGMSSSHMHVSTMLFKPGDRVTKGQQVATVGNGNGNYPCHEHFQIHTGSATMFSNRIDPLPVMRQWGADFCAIYPRDHGSIAGNDDCANPNNNDPAPGQ